MIDQAMKAVVGTNEDWSSPVRASYFKGSLMNAFMQMYGAWKTPPHVREAERMFEEQMQQQGAVIQGACEDYLKRQIGINPNIRLDITKLLLSRWQSRSMNA
jgi:hypothetical protein